MPIIFFVLFIVWHKEIRSIISFMLIRPTLSKTFICNQLFKQSLLTCKLAITLENENKLFYIRDYNDPITRHKVRSSLQAHKEQRSIFYAGPTCPYELRKYFHADSAWPRYREVLKQKQILNIPFQSNHYPSYKIVSIKKQSLYNQLILIMILSRRCVGL